MRILMLLQTSFPPDIRVENEIESLCNNGHDVFLLCKNAGRETSYSKWQQASLIRLIGPIKMAFLSKLMQIPVFFNVFWIWKAGILVSKYKINAVHIHDLPLAPIGILLKAVFKVSIIYDMHENYPAALRVWKKTGIEYWLKHPRIFMRLEKYTLLKYDRAIAVIEENKNRIIRKYGIDKKVIIVSNYVNLKNFKPESIYKDNQISNEKTIYLYTGVLDAHRGVDITLSAFRVFASNNPNVMLLLVGGGRSVAGKKTQAKLQQNINNDEVLKKSVVITGWVDYKYIPWFISISDYCLIPQAANSHTNTTVPHKLFQYMAFGKPVIAADAIPIKRILETTATGFTFQSNNVKDYIKVLEHSLNVDRNKIMTNSIRAVETMYSWKYAEKNLLSLYDTL